jgi:hypothetical protein
LFAQVQTETFPNSVFAGTTQAKLHELMLKVKNVNGQIMPASGFKVDFSQVINTRANTELALFTTDSALSIIKAQTKSVVGILVNLPKTTSNTFSLSGLTPGVYAIDIIAKK